MDIVIFVACKNNEEKQTSKYILINIGYPISISYDSTDTIKNNIKKLMDSDIICLLPGWKNNDDICLLVDLAKKLKIPQMILKDSKLQPRISILGVSGWARSGKDTFADSLSLKKNYKKISFAQPLKDILLILNPYIKEIEMDLKQAVNLHTWEGIKKYNEVRRLLQTMGTEIGRKYFGEDVWINLALDAVEDGKKVIISDVRFKNEANAIQELNGKIVRIVRHGVEAPNNHVSEHELDEYPFFNRILYNNGTKEDLIKKYLEPYV
jgi:hypothetical protein